MFLVAVSAPICFGVYVKDIETGDEAALKALGLILSDKITV
jgi:hypothetical protein